MVEVIHAEVMIYLRNPTWRVFLYSEYMMISKKTKTPPLNANSQLPEEQLKALQID